MRGLLSTAIFLSCWAVAYANAPKLGNHSALIAVNDRFNAAAAAHDAEALLELYAANTLWIAEGEPVS